jgi:ABC-type multidrug transport system ATPase subunit
MDEVNMITEFKIDTKYKSRMHFKECSFGRVNVLLGGNGSGKTTLIGNINEYATDKGIKVYKYFNSKDNDRHNNPNPMGGSHEYTEQLARRFISSEMSEGQSIIYGISKWVNEICIDYKNEESIVLLDEVDSGLSADHVLIVIGLLNAELFNKKNLQFFISSNMYHWVYALGDNLFNMYEGKPIKINSYEEYYKYLYSKQLEVGKKSGYNFLK